MKTNEITEKKFESEVQNVFIDYFNKNPNFTIHQLSEKLLSYFQNGLTWHDFSEISIPTKKEQLNKTDFKQIKDVNIFLLKELISPIFYSYFIKNLVDKNYPHTTRNTYRALGNKAFAHDFFDDNQLKALWDFFDYSNMPTYRNEFLINASSTKQLKQLTNLFNIHPLTIITKEKDIETFLLTNVCQREIFTPNYWCIKTNDFTKLQNEFIKLKEYLDRNDLQTEKTPIIDLKTRIAFTFSYLKDESKYNKFLNSIGIKEVNLNCEDYLFNKKNMVSFKDKLLENSKIKTLNKFNKNKKENITDISSLITTKPNKPNLISNKKSFLKNWLSTQRENINLTEILSDVVKTQYRKYEFSSLDIKCYFPIRYTYLDESDSYWKKPERKRYEQIEFLNLEFSSSYDCFFNLINYSNVHKNNIDWQSKVLNTTLANELYSLLLKLPTLPALNSENNTNMKSINSIFNDFKPEFKIEVLTHIAKNWDTIFDSKKEEELNSLFEHPYGMKSSFFTILNMILNETIKTSKPIHLENKDLIIASVEKYTKNSTDAQEIIQKVSYIELSTNLTEKSPEKRRLKI